VVASRRGHGDLAVGNIIGADILNVLFVAGASAAVTPTGLDADPVFFRALFPAMLFVLVVFRVGTIACPERLPRWFWFVLLAAYAVGLAASLVT
jgi:cation:H+ antiporter